MTEFLDMPRVLADAIAERLPNLEDGKAGEILSGLFGGKK